MSFGRLSARARRDVPRRSIGAVAVVSALSLALAACGGSDKPSATDPPDSSTPGAPTLTANAFTLNGEWPLTGETLKGDPPDHPIYAVKIDNTSSSAPQVGLGSADMVVEELVEGGLTRLAVFFDSDVPDVVGPVRSMRASDVGIVKPADATLVASGAANKTLRIINSHSIVNFTEGATGFYRDDSRAAPYNLFMKLSALAGTAKKVTEPKDSYLQFGSSSDFAGTIPVKSIAATFSGSHTTDWEYTAQGWARPDSFAASGDDFVPDNILLLSVKIGDAGYKDPAGNPVPETEFFGKGKAVLVHDDMALRCVWHKKGKNRQIHLVDKDGKEVQVPAGHTWIELVPNDTGHIALHK